MSAFGSTRAYAAGSFNHSPPSHLGVGIYAHFAAPSQLHVVGSKYVNGSDASNAAFSQVSASGHISNPSKGSGSVQVQTTLH